MVDLHSHILFGVDDGAQNLEETKQMLEMASIDGIHAIIATPHYDALNQDLIEKNYQEVIRWIEEMALPLKLYLGNETLLTDSLLEDIEGGKCKPLANSRYFLIEFYRHTHVYTIKHVLFKLCIKGYIPVIAHCERLVENKEDLKLLQELNDMGCMLQVNASKILKPEGRWQKRWMDQLLKSGAISFVASDAHNCSSRQPRLKQAYRVVSKRLGESVAQNVFINNQKEILKTSFR